MVMLRKKFGKWSVEVRRKGHRKIYETFDNKSDARIDSIKIMVQDQDEMKKVIVALFLTLKYIYPIIA